MSFSLTLIRYSSRKCCFDWQAETTTGDLAVADVEVRLAGDAVDVADVEVFVMRLLEQQWSGQFCWVWLYRM